MKGQQSCQRQEVTMGFPFQGIHKKADPQTEICLSNQMKLNKRNLGSLKFYPEMSAFIAGSRKILQHLWILNTKTWDFDGRFETKVFPCPHSSDIQFALIYPGKWQGEDRAADRMQNRTLHRALPILFLAVTKDVPFLPIASQVLSSGTIHFSILITLKQKPFNQPSRQPLLSSKGQWNMARLGKERASAPGPAQQPTQTLTLVAQTQGMFNRRSCKWGFTCLKCCKVICVTIS